MAAAGKWTSFEKSATPHAAVTPSLTEIYWAAGFIEGEGSFAGNGGREQVAVGQVQQEPLRRLQRFLGGSLRLRKATINDGHKRAPFWIWTACGSRARGIMMTMYPIMSPRRQLQIKTALKGA